MGQRGPAKRPALAVVREGNPGKKPLAELQGGVRLSSSAPPEPDWRQWLTAPRVPTVKQLEARWPIEQLEGALTHIEHDGKRRALAIARRKHLIAETRSQATRARDEAARAREVTRRTWRRIVPQLDAIGLLADIDHDILVDYCLVVARIDQAERDLTSRGVWVQGERGAMKNPSTTVLNQLRAQLRHYIGQLGLSPVARDDLRTPEGSDDGQGSPWD